MVLEDERRMMACCIRWFLDQLTLVPIGRLSLLQLGLRPVFLLALHHERPHLELPFPHHRHLGQYHPLVIHDLAFLLPETFSLLLLLLDIEVGCLRLLLLLLLLLLELALPQRRRHSLAAFLPLKEWVRKALQSIRPLFRRYTEHLLDQINRFCRSFQQCQDAQIYSAFLVQVQDLLILSPREQLLQCDPKIYLLTTTTLTVYRRCTRH